MLEIWFPLLLIPLETSSINFEVGVALKIRNSYLFSFKFGTM